MSRRIAFDHLLTARGFVSPGWISLDEAGWITGVGPGAGDEAIEGPGERIAGWAMPGIPNVHSHAFQRAMAGLAERAGGAADEDGFWRWREVMYRFVARITPDDLTAIAGQLYVEMLRAGYTAVGEFHYLHHGRDGRPYDDPAELSERVIAAAGRVGEPGEKRLAALLDQADYLIKRGHRDGLDPDTVRARIQAFEARDSVEVSIRRKKGEKRVELRHAVVHLRIATDEDRGAIPEGLADGLPPLTLALGLRLDPTGQVKPQEVLREILEAPDLELSPVELIRVGFWNHAENGLQSPLEPLVSTANS